jgi:plastocyanin
MVPPRLRAATIAAAVVAAALASSGRLPSSARAQTVVEVDILGNQYLPADITIPAGTVVTWVNQENQDGGTGALHTVVSLPDMTPLTPAPLNPGDSASFEYDTPGVYRYYCTLHVYMLGSITVQ